MWQAVLCTVALLLITWLFHWVDRWRYPAFNGRLPPGSMGLPLLGETIGFFSRSTTLEVHPFVLERMKTYGPIFKTSLVALPVVGSADPEFNRFVLQQEGRLFQSWYPATFKEIFGRQYVGAQHGFVCKYLKSLILKLFGPKNLREGLIHELEAAACRSLNSWMEQPHVELREATATMIFNLTTKKLISYDPLKTCENLRENFVAFNKGLISFPVNLPATAYHRCLQGRKKVMRVLKGILEERQRSAPERRRPGGGGGDFFDLLVEEMGKEGTPLTESMILDLVFALLFTSFETTSLALTLAVRFLTDHPPVLQKLTEEHEAIIRKREEPMSALKWEEYKSMTFTSQDEQELNDMSKNFMPFGGGMRSCMGMDFSKIQIVVFLHHLVTRYRWKVTKGGNIIRTPGLGFPQGFHIQQFSKPLE